MRILTVGSMYPPHALGGYEVLWHNSVEHLRAQGHEVHVLTTGFRVREAARHRDPTWIHRDLGWYWRDHAFPHLSARERLGLERRNGRVMDDRLRRVAPDVVCWWAMGGMSLSLIERVRRAGVPAVGVVGDDWMSYGPARDGWLGPLRGGRARRLAPVAGRVARTPVTLDLGSAAHWLFISDVVRDGATAYWQLPSTEVANPGIDADLFAPAPAQPWEWRLAVVGRIDPRKGIDVAIRALAKLPAEATLTVDGGGDNAHLAELRTLARELGLADRVVFQRSTRDQVPAAYAAADAVLMPVTWTEPWGLVPLEAMAVGRPVVTSGRGGQATYARDGENCLVAPAEAGPCGVADAVRRLAEDATLRDRLVDGGSQTAARYPARAFDEAVERALTARR